MFTMVHDIVGDDRLLRGEVMAIRPCGRVWSPSHLTSVTESYL